MVELQSVDLVTEELAIALAVIKRRNPVLWKNWVLKVGNGSAAILPSSQFPSQMVSNNYIAAKPAVAEKVSLALADRFMYRYVMGNSTSRHLEPACGFLNGRRLTFNDLADYSDVVRSLAIDVEDFEISKQLLPNYKLLKWLFAVNLDDNRRKKIAIHIVRSFQLVLTSYYSFMAVPKKAVSDVCQLLLLGFIKNEVLLFGASKTRIFKLLREYTSSRSIEQSDVSLQSLCNGHSKILALIIGFTIQEGHLQAVSDMIRFALQLLESLVVCLIKLTLPHHNETRNEKAFHEIYRGRSVKMSYKYVADFLDAARLLEMAEGARRLKICVEFLLGLLDSLQWGNTASSDPRVVAAFQQYRSNLLSEFLVLDDLDLITSFLQLPWPSELSA